MIRVKKEKTDFFRFRNLSQYSEIRHFTSSNLNKKTGVNANDLDLSYNTGKNKEIILNNREILSNAVKIPLENFIMQNQIHSDIITVTDQAKKSSGVYNHNNAIQNSDAMITNKRGLCLFLFAADCVPVLFYDKNNKVIGAAHSGWKGTVKKIAAKTAEKMHQIYKTKYEDIMVGIGPSISLKNYEVGQNVVEAVEETFGTTKNFLELNKSSGKYHFDLKYAVKQQLLESGISENNIETSDYCTFNRQDLFFSARGKKNTGRFGAGIILL